MSNGARRPTTPLAGDYADQVRMLFDAKAAGWPGKYAPDGRLAGRLSRLATAIAGLTPPGGDLLDLGCGSGELARNLAAAQYRVTGCDIAPRMLAQAVAADHEHAIRWIALDPHWRELPFAAGSLDTVVASSVLEYLPDPGLVLNECARVLRPGGVVVCTVPNAAHPVRWLEWPLGLAARTPLARPFGRRPGRAGQYLAYLATSRQRRRVGWWHAVAGKAGLGPIMPPIMPPGMARVARREPLRLLALTHATGGRAEGGRA
jgi:SAM-dependent methyltransferase